MKYFLIATLILLSGCGSKSEKFPVNLSCGLMGDLPMEPGLGVSIDKDKATFVNQTYIFQKQEGNLRQYKDDLENSTLVFDVISEAITLFKYEDGSMVKALMLSKCTKK